ncbi:MAG TPA: TIGR00375 family protein, partial [Desulfobacteria bacterium]|nr:TIGR00375 family protein [Desulfobacteria bacterium]
MKQFFADLHVHIGRAGNGLPVKITAARSLTVANILEECIVRKGIEVVGIVDASSPHVQSDLDRLIESGFLRQIEDGGLIYKDLVTLILGGEVETTDRVKGPEGDYKARSAHCLCYFPHLKNIKKFTRELSLPGRVKNTGLSSQKSNLTMQGLWEIANSLGGIMILAHAF